MSRNRVKSAILTPAQVVKELRVRKGWTQGVLGEITGIAVPNLSNIESGRSRLGEKRAILLAKALGVRPEFLLFPNGFERRELKKELEEIQRKIKKLEGEVAA